MTTPVSEFEALVRSGTPLSRSQAEAVLASPDLVAIGSLGELARKAATADRVAYGRVWFAGSTPVPMAGDQPGEARISAVPTSMDEARRQVREAAAAAPGVPLTGFSLVDLLNLAGGDDRALADVAAALRSEGLDAVAEVPVDKLGDAVRAAAAVRACVSADLGVRRVTVDQAPIGRRLDLIERVGQIQAETGAFKAFAPLPRLDPVDTPATGYDDVRTIAVARLMCRSIPFIQVDWPLYGPKLAQVAIAYGANDVDGVAAVDQDNLGRRRSPREEIERQIRAAVAVPAERDARYEWRR